MRRCSHAENCTGVPPASPSFTDCVTMYHTPPSDSLPHSPLAKKGLEEGVAGVCCRDTCTTPPSSSPKHTQHAHCTPYTPTQHSHDTHNVEKRDAEEWRSTLTCSATPSASCRARRSSSARLAAKRLARSSNAHSSSRRFFHCGASRCGVVCRQTGGGNRAEL